MARFIIPITIELQFETVSAQEALHKFYLWRKFIAHAMRGHLAKDGLFRFSIPPVREVTQVDDFWLGNHKLRKNFQQEWEYEVRQEPTSTSSKVMITHRIAIGPSIANMDAECQQQ